MREPQLVLKDVGRNPVEMQMTAARPCVHTRVLQLPVKFTAGIITSLLVEVSLMSAAVSHWNI
uniref:Uncharacterized protein n=1 Tax=Timema tahoe TaxID=61484 RepID=A0A7R9FKQ8_9NEOP|nr:unnamed protein product [Timema tahoe]